MRADDRYPSSLGVGVLPAPHPAHEHLFATLVGRNAINMHVPRHSSVVLYRSQAPAPCAASLHSTLNFAERVSRRHPQRQRYS